MYALHWQNAKIELLYPITIYLYAKSNYCFPRVSSHPRGSATVSRSGPTSELIGLNRDKDLDKRLAEFRKKNGGKSPNIFYILVDDIGFGDLGDKTLNAIRGYKTPNINQFARDGMRLARMYTEPSCTPTRVAFTTGRHPFRNGMGNTAVDISGFGLAEEEVTVAEILTKSGYNTVHIGKWHMGGSSDARRPGFDHWVSFRGQGTYAPEKQKLNVNGKHLQRQKYMTDELTDYATE